MKPLTWILCEVLLGTSVLLLPAYSQNSAPARPGTVIYVEGAASLGGSPNAPIRTVALDRNQTLQTQGSKLELLLGPGVFLKLDNDSLLRMISTDPGNTKVYLESGRAIIEATKLRKRNNIRIDEGGSDAKLEKNGVYEFDADHGQIRVFKGKLDVFAKDQTISLGRNRQLTLNNLIPQGKLETKKFRPKRFEDAFYQWSPIESGMLWAPLQRHPDA